MKKTPNINQRAKEVIKCGLFSCKLPIYNRSNALTLCSRGPTYPRGREIQLVPDSCHGNCYVLDVGSKSPGQRILKDWYCGCGEDFTKESFLIFECSDIKEAMDYMVVASRSEPTTCKSDQHPFSRISFLDESLQCRKLAWENVGVKNKTLFWPRIFIP